MKRGNRIVVVVIFFVLLVCAGLVWLLSRPIRFSLPAPPIELFKTYVLDPIPDSVTEIKANRTRAHAGYGYTFGFKISRADLDLIIDSQPFRKVERIRYHDRILDWQWNSGSGVMTF